VTEENHDIHSGVVYYPIRISILEFMSGDPEDNDLEGWFRPPWESDDEEALEAPGRRLRGRKAASDIDYDHPLLTPLARAQDALARLQVKAEMASPAVVEGLRARLSYREAAGWLNCWGQWIDPLDLALCDYGAVRSYGPAARADRLATVLPVTVAQHADLDHVVETGAIGLDTAANRALAFARIWRRLGEFRTCGHWPMPRQFTKP
jgi:hypothetical protein